MNTLLEEPASHLRAGSDSAERLRTNMAALRLSFTWFGVRKSLTADQRAEAAEAFGAERDVLSAGKRLLNTRHPKYKAVTAIRTRAVSLWRALSLPFPEPGIRLVKQGDVGSIDVQLTTFKEELREAVVDLDAHFAELKSAARDRLGRLYNESDYPATLNGLFEMSWDWPSVEPPPYLRQLAPELYREECDRARARFEESVHLAEQAFVDELSKLVDHLTERLAGADDGKPKIFRDSAIENLTSFFERFRDLNIGSNEQLDQLVGQAQNIVLGVEPQQLRNNDSLRQQVATQLTGVQSALDGLLVDRPRRNILRRPK